MLLTAGSHGALVGQLWGDGNTFDYAIELEPGTTLEYGAAVLPLTDTGAVNDTLIGGGARAYVALPHTNLTKLAGIIVS